MGINWQQLATPPEILSNALWESIGLAQADWYCGYHTKESKYVKWMGRTTPKAALDFHITIVESIKSWSKPASRG